MKITCILSDERLITCVSIIFMLLLISGGIVAQSQRGPLPDNISVAPQTGRPVSIDLTDTWTFNKETVMINYTVKNIDGRQISGIVLTGFPNSEKEVLIFEEGLAFGVTRSFGGGNIASGNAEKVLIKADHILFTDGTYWGDNSIGEADFLTGYMAGRKYAAVELRKQADKKDDAALKAFVKKQPYVTIPDSDKDKSPKWQEGFKRGVGNVMFPLNIDVRNRGDLSGVYSRLADLEDSLAITQKRPKDIKRISKILSFDDPLLLVGFDIAGKELKFEEEFTGDDEWLNGLRIKIKNTSGKTLQFVSLSMRFPETLATGNQMMFAMSYGQHGLFPQPERTEQTPIAPDAYFDIHIGEKEFKSLKHFLGERASLADLTRASISVSSVKYSEETKN
ncbi:MAG: hypothetical protein KF855_10955 [Acidobacteria bacterium]|nr:hypothetical protein [Acidobacteriota bacterium]